MFDKETSLQRLPVFSMIQEYYTQLYPAVRRRCFGIVFIFKADHVQLTETPSAMNTQHTSHHTHLFTFNDWHQGSFFRSSPLVREHLTISSALFTVALSYTCVGGVCYASNKTMKTYFTANDRLHCALSSTKRQTEKENVKWKRWNTSPSMASLPTPPLFHLRFEFLSGWVFDWWWWWWWWCVICHRRQRHDILQSFHGENESNSLWLHRKMPPKIEWKSLSKVFSDSMPHAPCRMGHTKRKSLNDCDRCGADNQNGYMYVIRMAKMKWHCHDTVQNAFCLWMTVTLTVSSGMMNMRWQNAFLSTIIRYYLQSIYHTVFIPCLMCSMSNDLSNYFCFESKGQLSHFLHLQSISSSHPSVHVLPLSASPFYLFHLWFCCPLHSIRFIWNATIRGI